MGLKWNEVAKRKEGMDGFIDDGFAGTSLYALDKKKGKGVGGGGRGQGLKGFWVWDSCRKLLLASEKESFRHIGPGLESSVGTRKISHDQE